MTRLDQRDLVRPLTEHEWSILFLWAIVALFAAIPPAVLTYTNAQGFSLTMLFSGGLGALFGRFPIVTVRRWRRKRRPPRLRVLATVYEFPEPAA